MKIWNVQSKWSEQLVVANSMIAAKDKYLRQARKELKETDPSLRCSPEPTEIKFVGDAI